MAETTRLEMEEQLFERARAKRVRKGVDLVVFNDVSDERSGFGSDDNAITIIGPDEAETALPVMSKRRCAEAILDATRALLASRPG